MRTNTHIIVTVKWKPEEYPLTSEKYKELQGRRGVFIHRLLQAYENSLTKQKEESEELTLLREIKGILRSGKIEIQSSISKTTNQKKHVLKAGIMRQYKT